MKVSLSAIGISALSLAAVLLGTARAAGEPSPPTFIGTLAQKEIVLQFLSGRDIAQQQDHFGKEQRAQYFYRSIGRIIPLVKTDDGWLAECQADFHNIDCARPTGYWLLPSESTNDGQSVLTAKWKATKAASALEVQLTAVQSDNDNELSAWRQLLGTGATKLVRRPNRKAVVVGVLTDTRSKVKVPQLISGYSGEVMESFNKKMRSRLVAEAAARLENISLNGGEEDSDEIQFQSPRWLVWGGGGGGYYGGNHGLYAYSFQVFDLTTGGKVDARTALFRHLSDKTLDGFLDKSDYARIPDKWLKDQQVIESLVLKEASKVDFKGKPDPTLTPYQIENSCVEDWIGTLPPISTDDEEGEMVATKKNQYSSEAGYQFTFELMPKFDGLAVVSNDFSEAARGCKGIMLTIPWNRVKSYLKQPL